MRKKFLSLLMALCLAMGLASMGIKANESVDVWDGTADISWYTGTEEVYEIDSAEALAGISQLSDEGIFFDEVTLILTVDVDLSDHEWIPITEFHGHFDGGNHIVANMYVEQEDGTSGFFGSLRGAIIENLTIKDATVIVPNTNGYFNHGILAGTSENFAYNNELKYTKIINCGTSGSITVDAYDDNVPSIGGFIGSCKNNTNVINCWSMATVNLISADEAAMVGGMVGQWENAAEGAQVVDCYFGGNVNVANSESSTGGIVGAALSFNGETLLISGCVSYGKFAMPEGAEGNAVHIVALDEDGLAENCIWADDGTSGAVRLVVDWSLGIATQDPNFDESICGHAVTDFSDPKVIETLNDYAQTENLWALGISGYPVFSTQTHLIRADYSAVDAAKENIPADLSLYTDESVNALNTLLSNIDENMSMDEQEEVNAMAKAIEDAISALVYKDADYSAANEAIEKANSLDKTLYKDFTEVEKALTAVVSDLDITHQEEVNAMAKAIEDAINALEYKDADYTAVNDAIAKAEALNPEDYVDFTHVSDAIDAVVKNLDITHQKEVDDMAQAILDAISELEEKPAETPSTSDNSYITCWMMIMIGAAMSLIGFVVYDYKKKLTH